MSVEEARRHRLYEAARRVIGEEEAATLMDYLPPDTAIEMLRADLSGEMRAFRAELTGEMRALRAELSGELHREVRNQTVRIITWMIPTWISCVRTALAVKLA